MRKSIDCRDYPSDMNCTVAISAASADENEFRRARDQSKRA